MAGTAARALSRTSAALGVAALLTLAASGSADPARRGWIGIAMAMAADGAPGVRIDHVVHQSPAERAGLHADDRILQVDGVAVATSREVVHALAAHGAGDAVPISITRASHGQQLNVLLVDYPSGDAILRMDHLGSPAPEWEGLEPSSGFPASIASLRGHVVVVDFWATWCGPCREFAPTLSSWQARYGAQGLSVVGITTDPADAAAAFKERLELRYPMASDPHGATSSAYGVSALPTVFVVDKRGVVRDLLVGTGPDEDARVEALIRTLLAEPAPSP